LVAKVSAASRHASQIEGDFVVSAAASVVVLVAEAQAASRPANPIEGVVVALSFWQK